MTDEQPITLPPARSRDGNLRCPHCFMPTHRRDSLEVEITHRSVFFVCTNTFCGFTFRATLSFDYGICPSAIPNPQMAHLPMRTPNRDKVMAAVREARALVDGSEIDLNQLDLFAAMIAGA